MKVIFIKIYGEAEEMVHVSVVSGTPLGPRDMTVISQITDRWGGAGPVDLAVRTTFAQNLLQKRLRQAAQASQRNLHLPLTSECKLPSG